MFFFEMYTYDTLYFSAYPTTGFTYIQNMRICTEGRRPRRQAGLKPEVASTQYTRSRDWETERLRD